MNETEIKALFAKLLAETGVMTKTDMNGTAALIRGLKESVDGMKTVNPMDALVAAGLLTKNADGTYAPKAVTAPAKKEDAVPAWQTQIDQLVAQGKAKDLALADANTQRAAGELKSAVITAFEKAGAVNASRDYVHVLSAVKRADDGTFHTISKDQFGVESTVGLDVAFGAFLKGNPELAKAAGHAGSGTPTGANITGTPGHVSTESYMSTRTKDLAAGDIKITF